jgi:hypothetical protein
MMGRRRRDQSKLFYELRLDDRIPTHLCAGSNRDVRCDPFVVDEQPRNLPVP